MSQDFSPAIAALHAQLTKKEQEVRHTKRLINELSVMGGVEKPFPDADLDQDAGGSLGALRRDQFYGVPLATAIREYMKMRRSAGSGPATVADIYDALMRGGFKFDTKNEQNAKRGLYISLAKNNATFHKLPGGSGDAAAVFGLKEWYPNAKPDEEQAKPKAKKRGKASQKKPHVPVGDAARESAKTPEKGEAHEESKSAGQRRGKSTTPTP